MLYTLVSLNTTLNALISSSLSFCAFIFFGQKHTHNKQTTTLIQGAINTLMMHGTEELKNEYLPPLVSGEMTGTMCLTEPGCGSDLGQVCCC
jgi:hypothetical protein